MLFFEFFERNARAHLGRSSFARGGRPAQIVRQVRQFDLPSTGENGGAFHHVAQFAQISRPTVVSDGLLGCSGKALDLLAALAREETQIIPRDFFQVRCPFAQGRHVERDDVEPVEEVFAESTGGDRLLQVSIRGGDQPHVGGQGFSVSHLLVLFVLQEPE